MIGVLALQGAFQKHRDCLIELGVSSKLVKTIEELSSCDALILPGGESTVHQKLMSPAFWKALQNFAQSKPTFGTCCGLILMASALQNDSMQTLGVLNITINRNAYGSQKESFEAEVNAEINQKKIGIKGCFIRAPKIVAVGSRVKVLAVYENIPVVVEQDQALGCSFHPEIFQDSTLHRYFLSKLIKN